MRKQTKFQNLRFSLYCGHLLDFEVTTQIKFLISEYVRKKGNNSAPVGLPEKFNSLNERLFQDEAFEVINFSVAPFLESLWLDRCLRN